MGGSFQEKEKEKEKEKDGRQDAGAVELVSCLVAAIG
jgi:hypothetical protein